MAYSNLQQAEYPPPSESANNHIADTTWGALRCVTTKKLWAEEILEMHNAGDKLWSVVLRPCLQDQELNRHHSPHHRVLNRGIPQGLLYKSLKQPWEDQIHQ